MHLSLFFFMRKSHVPGWTMIKIKHMSYILGSSRVPWDPRNLWGVSKKDQYRCLLPACGNALSGHKDKKKSVPFCTVSCSWTSSAHPVQSCPAEEFCSHVLSPLQWEYATNMSTGSLSDVDDELLDGILKFGSSGKDSNESTEESSNCEGSCANEERRETPGKKRKTTSRKTAPKGVAQQEGKQVQRNAANARERARMRVLSKAFSRLKTSLPWVPPDTKLSKLDTLRLASSYIAHLRQILANDKYENGYIHPVNLVRMGLRGLYLFAPQIFTLPIWSFNIIM